MSNIDSGKFHSIRLPICLIPATFPLYFRPEIMEQFRQIGEVVGSLKALMVFRDEIQINRHHCCLLLDILSHAYESVAEEMKQNLIFKEKQTKWKVIEQPLKELHRIFKEVEIYIRQSLEPKDRWVQAITFYQNKACVEFHIHNLLSCVPGFARFMQTD